MTSKPSTQAPAPAYTIQVRLIDGELAGRADSAGAAELVALGWAVPIGNPERPKWLRMTTAAPEAMRRHRGLLALNCEMLDQFFAVCPGGERLVRQGLRRANLQ